MRDVEDAEAARSELFDHGEHPVELGPRQDRRRLVEDQHPRLEDECTCDLDELPLGDAQRRDLAPEPDVRPHPIERVARLALHHLPLEHAGGDALLAAEEHVLEHGQRRDEARLLVDGADAVVTRLLRRQRPHLLAGDQHLAGAGTLRPGHDLHERRLAGAVLPDECVDLAGEDFEGHVVERGDPAVVLRDMPRRNERSLEVLHAQPLLHQMDRCQLGLAQNRVGTDVVVVGVLRLVVLVQGRVEVAVLRQ